MVYGFMGNYKGIIASAMLFLSSAFSSEVYLSDNHRDWHNGREKLIELRETKPSFVSDLEKRVFSLSTNSYSVAKSKRKIPKYNSAENNPELYVDLLRTCGFFSQEAVVLSGNLVCRDPSQIKYENLESFIEDQALKLSENRELLSYLKKRDIQEIDCRALSTIACALYLNLNDRPREISLIIGLVFDKDLAPEGEGHMWVVVDGKIVDPALAPIKDRQSYYVPLVGVSFGNSDETIILRPKLYNLPKEF